VARDTGWTFREIEAMTLHDLRDLQRSWAGCPPMHVLAAVPYRDALKLPAQPRKRVDVRALAESFGLKVRDGDGS
jgi:hypothetical protein